MDLLEYLRRQFAYDAWANREVLAAIKKGADETTHVRQLLAHILSAEKLWLERILQKPQSLAVWPDVSFEQCELQMAELKQQWQKFFQQLTPARLQEKVTYKNSKGEPWESSLGDILSHVAMHSAYHRGQIASRMRADGATPPLTDFIHAVRTGAVE